VPTTKLLSLTRLANRAALESRWRVCPLDFEVLIQVDHRASPDLQRMKLCYAGAVVGTEVGLPIGAIKPEYKLDPGFPEHLRLSPRAVNGPGARFLEFFFAGPHADDRTRRGR
jgi:hypothetical protein